MPFAGEHARNRKDLELGQKDLLQIECLVHEQVEAEGSAGSLQVLSLGEELWLERRCTLNCPQAVGGRTRDRKGLELDLEDLLQIEQLGQEQVEAEEAVGILLELFLVEEL